MKFRLRLQRPGPQPVIAVPETPSARGRPKVPSPAAREHPRAHDHQRERHDDTAQPMSDREITLECERVAHDVSRGSDQRSSLQRPLADFETDPRPILRRRQLES